MTIFYSQILSNANLEILTGAFSTHAGNLESNFEVLRELRSVIEKIPLKGDDFFVFKSECIKFLFYIKTTRSVTYSIIADITCSEQTALKYFANIEALFTKQFNPTKKNYTSFNETIKASTNNFNQDIGFMEIGADLEKTKGIYCNSLNALLKRGETLKNINDLAEVLNNASENLKTKWRKAYVDSYTQQYYLYAVLLVIIFLFMYFLLR